MVGDPWVGPMVAAPPDPHRCCRATTNQPVAIPSKLHDPHGPPCSPCWESVAMAMCSFLGRHQTGKSHTWMDPTQKSQASNQNTKQVWWIKSNIQRMWPPPWVCRTHNFGEIPSHRNIGRASQSPNVRYKSSIEEDHNILSRSSTKTEKQQPAVIIIEK